MAEEEVAAVVGELRGSFRSGRTRAAEWRAAQLRGIVRMVEEREGDISDALHSDLAKPRMESYLHEVSAAFVVLSFSPWRIRCHGEFDDEIGIG